MVLAMLASIWIQYGGNFTLLPGSSVTVCEVVLVPTVGDTTPPLDLCDADFRTPDTVLDLIGDQRPCACAKGTVDALLIRWQVQCGADREGNLPHEPQVLNLPDVREPQIRFDEDLQRIASLQWFGEACDPCFQFLKTGEPTEESVRKRVAT